MASTKKNTTLLIVLLFLFAITAFLLISDEVKKKMVAKEDYFAIQDVSKINKIILKGPDFNHTLALKNGEWQVNSTYPVDQNLMEVLQTILKKVAVKRPVPKAEQKKVSEILANRGVLVEVHGEDKLLRSFVVAGSDDKTASYFHDIGNDVPFVMYIPGYDSYIAGIFELKLHEWRNKLIFSSNWRSLRSVEVSYPGNRAASFEIVFEKDFFKIPGIGKIDTTIMMAYLENLEYFKADNLLADGEYPRYDSLLKTTPLVEITVMDIDTAKNNMLQLYHQINEDPFVLGSTDNHQALLIRYPRLEPFLKSKTDFIRNENVDTAGDQNAL